MIMVASASPAAIDTSSPPTMMAAPASTSTIVTNGGTSTMEGPADLEPTEPASAGEGDDAAPAATTNNNTNATSQDLEAGGEEDSEETTTTIVTTERRRSSLFGLIELPLPSAEDFDQLAESFMDHVGEAAAAIVKLGEDLSASSVINTGGDNNNGEISSKRSSVLVDCSSFSREMASTNDLEEADLERVEEIGDEKEGEDISSGILNDTNNLLVDCSSFSREMAVMGDVGVTIAGGSRGEQDIDKESKNLKEEKLPLSKPSQQQEAEGEGEKAPPEASTTEDPEESKEAETKEEAKSRPSTIKQRILPDRKRNSSVRFKEDVSVRTSTVVLNEEDRSSLFYSKADIQQFKDEEFQHREEAKKLELEALEKEAERLLEEKRKAKARAKQERKARLAERRASRNKELHSGNHRQALTNVRRQYSHDKIQFSGKNSNKGRLADLLEKNSNKKSKKRSNSDDTNHRTSMEQAEDERDAISWC